MPLDGATIPIVEYEIAPALNGELPAPGTVTKSILLPITTPPVQVPHLTSAGIALSEFRAADDYSSTDPRRRMLWLEFESPPADPVRPCIDARNNCWLRAVLRPDLSAATRAAPIP